LDYLAPAGDHKLMKIRERIEEIKIKQGVRQFLFSPGGSSKADGLGARALF
jgi:hypothetical protein